MIRPQLMSENRQVRSLSRVRPSRPSERRSARRLSLAKCRIGRPDAGGMIRDVRREGDASGRESQSRLDVRQRRRRRRRRGRLATFSTHCRPSQSSHNANPPTREAHRAQLRLPTPRHGSRPVRSASLGPRRAAPGARGVHPPLGAPRLAGSGPRSPCSPSTAPAGYGCSDRTRCLPSDIWAGTGQLAGQRRCTTPS